MKDISLLPLSVLVLGSDSRTLPNLWLQPLPLISTLRFTEGQYSTGVPTGPWNPTASPFPASETGSSHVISICSATIKNEPVEKEAFHFPISLRNFLHYFLNVIFCTRPQQYQLKLNSTLSRFHLLAPERNICCWPLCAWPCTSSYCSNLPGHPVIIALFSSLLTVPPTFILSSLIWSVMSPIVIFFVPHINETLVPGNFVGNLFLG